MFRIVLHLLWRERKKERKNGCFGAKLNTKKRVFFHRFFQIFISNFIAYHGWKVKFWLIVQTFTCTCILYARYFFWLSVVFLLVFWPCFGWFMWVNFLVIFIRKSYDCKKATERLFTVNKIKYGEKSKTLAHTHTHTHTNIDTSTIGAQQESLFHFKFIERS